MKAITLHQPYASLVADELKRYETRSWAPPRRLLGQRIAIHAAKKRGINICRSCVTLTHGGRGFASGDEHIRVWDDEGRHLVWYPLGVVLATVALLDFGCVVDTDDDGPGWVKVQWSQAAFATWDAIDAYGDYSMGRYLWALAGVRVIIPSAPARGYQGFWEWDPQREANA